MTNAKTTKRALGSSILALVLCFAMLLGTTYAWFTDSVTSANNVIMSGNLDIELEYWDGDSWEDVAGKSDILTNTLWEPGVTEVAYLRVANAGSLALKYQLGINIVSEIEGVNAAGDHFRLSDYIQFGVFEGLQVVGENKAPVLFANRNEAVSFAQSTAKKISAGYTKSNALYPVNNVPADVDGASSELYLALVVYMPESVGNEANHNGVNVPEIELGINVFATQYTYEQDSYDENYDDNAKNEFLAVATANSEEPTKLLSPYAPSRLTSLTTIEAAQGDFATGTVVSAQITTEGSLFNVTASGDIVGSLNVDITAVDLNGQAVSTDGKTYTVTTFIAKGLSGVTVEYTGADGKAQPTNVVYDAVSGKLTFTTTHFSEYAVSGKALAYDLEKDVAFATVEAVVDEIAESVNTSTELTISIVEDIVGDVAVELGNAIENAVSNKEVWEELRENIYTAKIGESYFLNLQMAIDNAEAGDTVTLLADYNFDVTIDNASLTLDLNGFTITADTYDAVTVTGNSVVTVLNGTLISDNFNCGGIYAKNSTVVLDNCTLIGENIEESCGVYASNGSNFTINNCTLKAPCYGLIMMSASVVVNNVTVKADCSISSNGSDAYDKADLTINSGSFTGGIYWPAQGKLTINGGTFIDDTAVYLKSGSLEITGGIFTGNGEKKDYQYTASAGNATGSALVIENVGAGEYDAITSVSISGGTFISENNLPIESVTAEMGADAITSYIATGYELKDFGGYYSVVLGAIKVSSEAELRDALNNAVAGDKIDATGVVLNMAGADIFFVPAGITLKGLTVNATYRGISYFICGDNVVLENCSFGNTNRIFALAGDATSSKVTVNDCIFSGAAIINFHDNQNGEMYLNNCTFTKSGSTGYSEAMGGTHYFNNCTFDYTGIAQGSMGVLNSGSFNVYSESDYEKTVAILTDCTRINCGTRTYGPKSTLTVK